MSANKPAGPGVGYNHNVKYGSRVYHVQTEDSGLPHAHYITHLFVGGNIVASTKTSYADKVADPELGKTVRLLMEAQHKHMLKRLVSGEFKDLAERLAATHYEPGVLATGQTGPAAVNTAPAESRTPIVVKPVSPAVNPPAAAPLAPVAPRPTVPARPQGIPIAPRAAPPMLAPQPAAARASPPGAPQIAVPQPGAVQVSPPGAPQVAVPSPAPGQSPVRPAPAASPASRPPAPRAPAPAQPLWQAAPPGASPAPSPRQPGAPLPSVTRAPPQTPRPAVAPPRMVPVVGPPAARPVPPPPPRPVAPTRASPPSLFSGDAPVEAPHDDLPTLFAEELISEKSLDEVILAFLSADLEPHK